MSLRYSLKQMVKILRWGMVCLSLLTYLLVLPKSALAADLNSEVLTNLVNEHRLKVGKAIEVPEERICAIAESRAPAVAQELYSGRTHAGFYALSLPYWATEIVIAIRTEAEALNWWLNSPIHRSIVQGDYQYACIKCSGNACSGIFTNFQPKS